MALSGGPLSATFPPRPRMVRSSGSHLGREKNINKNWGCGKKMESLERDLHCPVCLDVYTKPVLMLPCQHNLCRQCVQNIVYTQDEDDEGYRGGPGRPSAFPCPQCRQCTYLGRRGIDGLKRNILVENIVDSYREVAAQIKKKVVCAEHEDERPSLYCSSHEKAICALCKLVGEHKECEVQELKNVLADKKGMLQGKVQLLEDRSHQLDRFIQENKTLSKSVEDKCSQHEDMDKCSQHKDMVRRETLALFSIKPYSLDKCSQHKDMVRRETLALFSIKPYSLVLSKKCVCVRVLQDKCSQHKDMVRRETLALFSIKPYSLDKCSQHKDMVRRETLALFSIISKRQSTLYDKLEVEKEEKLASLSGQVARCEDEKGRVAGLVRDAEVLMKEEEPTRFVEFPLISSKTVPQDRPLVLQAALEGFHMCFRSVQSVTGLTLGAESEELTPCVDEEFEHCLVDFKEAQDMLKKLDFVEGASGRTSPDRQPCPGPNCSAYGDSVYNNLCSKCYRVLTAANSGAQTDQDGKKNSQTQDSSGQPSSAAQQSSSQTCPTSPDRQSQWSYNSQSPGGSPARGRGRRNSGGRGPSLYYCNCPQCAGVQFQLDWMSAPQCLRLSNYNTTITHMPNRGHQPFGPHHVLADISVNSGRIYWEVFVGNSRGFRVGVTYDRDYPAREFLGGNNYSWALRYDYMCTLDGVIRFQAIHDCREVVVEVDTLPRSLGVLLDYDRGRLSCYNVGRGHIFTFFCSFREPIVPAFDVWKGSINIRTGLPPNSL
ncbi:hypothetical protein Bbelb_167810 [Branchiostoma belcheri]|nr:hypothetical protein Bbelb_167810 [Branchiostoma belcheri]